VEDKKRKRKRKAKLKGAVQIENMHVVGAVGNKVGRKEY
jgi:hypothetical protein